MILFREAGASDGSVESAESLPEEIVVLEKLRQICRASFAIVSAKVRRTRQAPCEPEVESTKAR